MTAFRRAMISGKAGVAVAVGGGICWPRLVGMTETPPRSSSAGSRSTRLVRTPGVMARSDDPRGGRACSSVVSPEPAAAAGTGGDRSVRAMQAGVPSVGPVELMAPGRSAVGARS